MNEFLTNYAGWGTQALSLALGAVFIVHGWAKVKNPAMVAGIWGGSKALGAVHGFVEVAAGLAVALGLWASYGAIAMAVIMLGALWFKIVKWKTPFWAKDSTGWELDLVLLAGALTILLG